MSDEFACPGHIGECVFCKSKWGYPRKVGDMTEVNRVTGNPKVDPCCKHCAHNMRYGEHEYPFK